MAYSFQKLKFIFITLLIFLHLMTSYTIALYVILMITLYNDGAKTEILGARVEKGNISTNPENFITKIVLAI